MVRAFLLGWSLAWCAAVSALVIVSAYSGAAQDANRRARVGKAISRDWPDDVEPWVMEALRG